MRQLPIQDEFVHFKWEIFRKSGFGSPLNPLVPSPLHPEFSVVSYLVLHCLGSDRPAVTTTIKKAASHFSFSVSRVTVTENCTFSSTNPNKATHDIVDSCAYST